MIACVCITLCVCLRTSRLVNGYFLVFSLLCLALIVCIFHQCVSLHLIFTENHALTNGEQTDATAETESAKPENGTAEDAESGIYDDSSFNIKVVLPGIAEPLEIPVSAMEMVQEIHQMLMDREDSCHRTCFSLQLDGITLDNFAELKSIENLKDGSVLKVVEEPYTVREARIHLRHVRDLLKSLDPTDAYNGLENASLSFLNV